MTKPVADPALQALDLRSRDIFRRIVDSFLLDGEPVGSRNLSRMLPSSLSPATVRNVMSDLEHLGRQIEVSYDPSSMKPDDAKRLVDMLLSARSGKPQA